MSTEIVAEAAAQDAARQAMARLGAVTANLAIVFATTHYREKYPVLVSTIRAITGATHLVGTSASGVLSTDGECEGAPGVVVLVVREPALDPVTFMTSGRLAEAGGIRELAAALGPGAAEGGFMLLFPDIAREAPQRTLASLAETIGFVPVTGGAAAGDAGGMRGVKFHGNEVSEDALAGVLLHGPESIVVGVSSACEPIGRPYTVTKADGNVVEEIAGKPAAEILAKTLVEVAPVAPGRSWGDGPGLDPGTLLLGIAMNPAKYPLTRGDFLIRALSRIDPEAGAIAVTEQVRVGQTVQFHLLDREAAHQDLVAMLTRLRVRLANQRPRFGLYVNCAGRGQGLFGVPDHDVTLIREVLGDFPLAGFFSRAEIAPQNEVNLMHQFTGVLTVFS